MEGRLRRVAPRALIDGSERAVRAFVALSAGVTAAALDASLTRVLGEHRIVFGRSATRRGLEHGRCSLNEAEDAAAIGGALLAEGGIAAYEQLGAYRYLVRVPERRWTPRRSGRSDHRLAAYDARRKTELVRTLENVPAGALQPRRGCAVPLHPHEHAAAAAAPHGDPLRPRPRDGGSPLARVGDQGDAPPRRRVVRRTSRQAPLTSGRCSPAPVRTPSRVRPPPGSSRR